MHVCVIDKTTGKTRYHEDFPGERAQERAAGLRGYCELQARDEGEDLMVYIGKVWPPPEPVA
jgi:hypothetical protein